MEDAPPTLPPYTHCRSHDTLCNVMSARLMMWTMWPHDDITVMFFLLRVSDEPGWLHQYEPCGGLGVGLQSGPLPAEIHGKLFVVIIAVQSVVRLQRLRAPAAFTHLVPRTWCCTSCCTAVWWCHHDNKYLLVVSVWWCHLGREWFWFLESTRFSLN